MKKYIKSAQMKCLEKFNGGVVYLLPDLFLKICTLLVLANLWRVVMSQGADPGMTMPQMLTYTWVSALLAELLVVQTQASGWLSEGVLMRYYGRPLSVLGQLTAETMGGWVPTLLLFSLPMTLAAPLFGVGLRPASGFFVPSLLLCVSLGFAIDALFACLCLKLRNSSWLIGRVRTAIVTLLSGTIIPIRLLPLGLAEAMQYQPFASLGGAVLSIYTGAGDPGQLLGLQVVWNLILWPVALLVFHKSQEGMVSYGG